MVNSNSIETSLTVFHSNPPYLVSIIESEQHGKLKFHWDVSHCFSLQPTFLGLYLRSWTMKHGKLRCQWDVSHCFSLQPTFSISIIESESNCRKPHTISTLNFYYYILHIFDLGTIRSFSPHDTESNNKTNQNLLIWVIGFIVKPDPLILYVVNFVIGFCAFDWQNYFLQTTCYKKII